MSLALTSFASCTSRRTTLGCSSWIFTLNSFKFKIIAVVSSITPGIVENSCKAPSILIEVTACPGRDESKTRRRELPRVMPKPLSSGSTRNLPKLSSSLISSTVILGFSISITKNNLPSNLVRYQAKGCLAGIKLDDEMFLDGNVDLFSCRQVFDPGYPRFCIQFQPFRDILTIIGFKNTLNMRGFHCFFSYLDDFARFYLVGRDIDFFAVNLEKAVSYHLTRFPARRGQLQSIDYIVQSGLENLQ